MEKLVEFNFVKKRKTASPKELSFVIPIAHIMCSAKQKYNKRHLLFSYLITREVTTELMLILNLLLVQNGNPSLVKTKLQRIISEQRNVKHYGSFKPFCECKKNVLFSSEWLSNCHTLYNFASRFLFPCILILQDVSFIVALRYSSFNA